MRKRWFKIGKPKYACQECGRDYQSKAAVNRHIGQKHEGKARVISFTKLLADVKDGVYTDHLVGVPTKRSSSGVDIARIMQEELTREAARIFSKGILPNTLSTPELWAPGVKTVLAGFIAVLRYLFKDLVIPDLKIPEPKIENEEVVKNSTFTRSKLPQHEESTAQPYGTDGPTKKVSEMTSWEVLREILESGRMKDTRNKDPHKPDTK